jgi:membrane protease YdiL (CAAX protease family)
MIVILFVGTQMIGFIPLLVLKLTRVSDNPDLMPSPENILDFSAYDINPVTGLAMMLIPFILGLFTLLFLMKPIHERPKLSVITGYPSFRWKKFFWGAGVWVILLVAYAVIASATGIQKIKLQFDPSTFYTLVAVSVLLLPLQTGFEEVFFRGYLMQGFAKLFHFRWIPLIITALIFGSLHIFNPEVKAFGVAVMLPQYIWFGIFFGICTLMDEGLELAWGVHAVNNIFLSVFFTQDSSAIQTPALYRITEFSPIFDLIALFVLSVIFIFVARQKFKWPEWQYLLAKIDRPVINDEELSEFIEDEYDEYEEK